MKIHTPLLLLALAGVPPALTAQSASVTYYGKSCFSTPLLYVNGLPKLGRTVYIDALSGHRVHGSSGMRYLVFGLSDKRLGNLRLPIPMKSLFGGMYDCGSLLNSAELILPQPVFRNGPKWVSRAIRIPNDRTLLGFTVHVQSCAAVTGYFSLTRQGSRGAKLVVGL